MNEALWALGRGTGVSALVLLTVATALGILTSGGLRHRELPRFALTEIHRRASLAATGFLLLHVLSLWLDPEAQLNAVDVVVPFLNERNPLWWGLGTLALDLLVVVAVSSLVRKHLSYAVWRGLHLLAYAMWPVAVLHSLGGGHRLRQLVAAAHRDRLLRGRRGSPRLPPRGAGAVLQGGAPDRTHSCRDPGAPDD